MFVAWMDGFDLLMFTSLFCKLILLVRGKICDNNQNYIYSLHLGNAFCFLPLLILILVVGLSLCRYESWLSGSVQRGRLQLQELLPQKS